MMTNDISHTEASLALDVVKQRQHDVLAEIDVPQWYWPALAAGWAGLGVLADYGPGWASGLVTVLFGTAHATIGPRVLSGRHGSRRVSIRHDAVSHLIPVAIIGFLIAMVALTIGIALVLNADGTRHPATVAGVVVAGLVLTGGPSLMAQIRLRAQRRVAS